MFLLFRCHCQFTQLSLLALDAPINSESDVNAPNKSPVALGAIATSLHVAAITILMVNGGINPGWMVCRKASNNPDAGGFDMNLGMEPEDVAEACMLAIRTSQKCFPEEIILSSSIEGHS